MKAICAPPSQHQDWAGRAQVTLTILLTCVAFKFLILENLPKIPDITRLDYYINCCFAMVFVISISSSILAAQRDRISEDTAEVVDAVIFYASILLWVGFHVWFIWKTRSFIHLMKRAHRLTGGARHPGGLVVPADVESVRPFAHLPRVPGGRSASFQYVPAPAQMVLQRNAAAAAAGRGLPPTPPRPLEGPNPTPPRMTRGRDLSAGLAITGREDPEGAGRP
mmetsp:Transcript_39233/g.125000  ORF Transcript_39233/g.125000 Transcript_39233/m.125000 type:complete len:223 (-) Transcript_39233:38-706(-)